MSYQSIRKRKSSAARGKLSAAVEIYRWVSHNQLKFEVVFLGSYYEKNLWGRGSTFTTLNGLVGQTIDRVVLEKRGLSYNILQACLTLSLVPTKKKCTDLSNKFEWKLVLHWFLGPHRWSHKKKKKNVGLFDQRNILRLGWHLGMLGSS